jgi:hypothetical protein
MKALEVYSALCGAICNISEMRRVWLFI